MVRIEAPQGMEIASFFIRKRIYKPSGHYTYTKLKEITKEELQELIQKQFLEKLKYMSAGTYYLQQYNRVIRAKPGERGGCRFGQQKLVLLIRIVREEKKMIVTAR
jgi:hypothetical protein